MRKQALIVRRDLGMKCGKIAAQCCHAAVQAEKRVVLQVPGSSEFWQLHDKAKVMKNGIEQVFVVHDAGLTQVDPGSATVLSIVGSEDAIDILAAGLRLL